MSQVIYNKPPLDAQAQANLLQQRGLIIADIVHAERFFASNSYYRFSAYTYVFENESASGSRSHSFTQKRPTFEQIERLYNFDMELRELTLQALRYIEVGVRTKICLELTLAHGDGHFFLDPIHFNDAEAHTKTLAKFANDQIDSRETFIVHYRNKYQIPELAPLWMIVEISTFGTVSKFFGELTLPNQKIVAAAFDLGGDHLASWLGCLSYTRNLCAHHSRLWNRKFTKKPINLRRILPTSEIGSYAQVAGVIKHVLTVAEPDFPYSQSLKALLVKYSEIQQVDLGFTGEGLDGAYWD